MNTDSRLSHIGRRKSIGPLGPVRLAHLRTVGDHGYLVDPERACGGERAGGTAGRCVGSLIWVTVTTDPHKFPER
jgi:hypothetical protein